MDWTFSSLPSAHPVCGGPRPESVVLDITAYLDKRTNASTAEGFTTSGHRIKVTFWVAHPPHVSYFTVCLPDLPDLTAFAELPRILRTDEDLVLLRVAVCPRYLLNLPEGNDYIIYRAGVKKLEVLPHHPTTLFSDKVVGLLRCRANDWFMVASLRSAWCLGQYFLDLFDSRTSTWSTKSMSVEAPHAQTYSFAVPTKVIAIGGEHGSIGWVDLMHGILICDTFRGDNILRYIELPLLLVGNKMVRGPRSADRDITVSNSSIKFFEMCVHPVPGSHVGNEYISQDWQGATWTWMHSEKNWHMECSFTASEIMVDKRYSGLFPTLHHDEATKMKPTLSRLHTGHPALSLHEDAVVYIMAKVDHRDKKGWMIAVDMENKSLKGVVDFDAERTWGFSYTYNLAGYPNICVLRLKKKISH